MTEKTVGLVPIADLATVRIQCVACATTFEMDLTKLYKAFERQQCPNCNAVLSTEREEHNPFSYLAAAIQRFQDIRTVEVEFVVPKAS